jgi:cysteine desulfurase
VNELNADLLSVSGHKIYGPKGIGVLFIRKGTKINKFFHGGEQEKQMRAGTENAAAIVGLAKAVEIAVNEMDKESPRITALRDRMINGILNTIPDTKLNGHPKLRLANNINVSIKYIEGESMILNLDIDGVSASTGSACSSGSLSPSHVLMALGINHEEAHGSLRFSLGKYTDEKHVDYAIKALSLTVARLRKFSPLYGKDAGK